MKNAVYIVQKRAIIMSMK